MTEQELKNQDFRVDVEVAIDDKKVSENELRLIEAFMPDILMLVTLEQVKEEG